VKIVKIVEILVKFVKIWENGNKYCGQIWSKGKVQNTCTKPLLKHKNTPNKPCLETADFGANVKNLAQQKVAKNVTISLGNFILT
jgi:hypothetical protein